MTEVKIPFAKVEVKKYSGSDKPANAEVLELEISPIFFSKFYEEVPFDSYLTKMRLKFLDGVEKEIYNELLDEGKVSFELSFEKEKVDFWTGKNNPDNTKIGINYLEMGGGKNVLEIDFEPQFAGVVKIANKDNKDNKLDKEISNLKFKL